LRKLGIVYTNYNELFRRFELEGIQYELKGLKYTPSEVIGSHRIKNILKNRSRGLAVKLCFMEVKQEDENIREELKFTLEKNHRVFQ